MIWATIGIKIKIKKIKDSSSYGSLRNIRKLSQGVTVSRIFSVSMNYIKIIEILILDGYFA